MRRPVDFTSPKRPMTAVAACILALTLPVTVVPHAAAQSASPVDVASGPHGGTFEVPVNKSQVLRVDQAFGQALIGNPEIADIMPLTNRSLYVLGKKPGSTSLTLYDRNKNLIAVVDLVVGPDVMGLKKQLHDLMPNERVGARISNDAIVLSGIVSSGTAVDRARQIAETYAPGKVVNMMAVGSSQQVLLEVRFSEMLRSAAKQIGVSSAFSSDSGKFLGSTGSSVSLLADESGNPVIALGEILDTFGILSGSFDIGKLNITGFFDALERKGVVNTLAEPNLVALSGETASFLAGGEFPIPVSQDSGGGGGGGGLSRSITVEFKPFGVSLGFTPTVLEDGLINLVVAPEVSSIDPSASVVINGLTIPGLQTRRAKTTLELRDGQSFAIAGLIRNDFQDTVRQFPVLGSIPIIGSLFRSTGFQKQETELVIIVTPRLVKPTTPESLAVPTDRAAAPNELDLFLLGRTDKAVGVNPINPTQPPVDRPKAVASSAPTGVDGDYGHILR